MLQLAREDKEHLALWSSDPGTKNSTTGRHSQTVETSLWMRWWFSASWTTDMIELAHRSPKDRVRYSSLTMARGNEHAASDAQQPCGDTQRGVRNERENK